MLLVKQKTYKTRKKKKQEPIIEQRERINFFMSHIT